MTPKDLLVYHPESDDNPDPDEYECAAAFLTYSGFDGFVPIMHYYDHDRDEIFDLFLHDGTYYIHGRDLQGIWKIPPPATLEDIVTVFANATPDPCPGSAGYKKRHGVRCLRQLRESGIGYDVVPEY